ncbi:condensation domain-containing protein [Streptomyces sp. NPDC006879]|uniref:condensation domain-containing protein n=1 Tax=Streptomyces sp. NPDC006879 TaxID=3364767 RepID=UPI0036737DFC
MTTRTITVAYAGGAARRGPVTMGQANMIRCILRDDPTHINNHAVWPVPAGTGLDAAIEALHTLVVRHEALRTTFPTPSDTAPREQVASAEGEFTVTVLDHELLPQEVADYAEAIARQARAGRFRLDREFPLRISFVCLGGTPVFVAMASSHAVTDGSALTVLREEWLSLLAGETLPPLTALTPLDLAAEEATPAGVRRAKAAVAHWERIIRTGPQAMFAEPRATGTDSRQPQLTLRSQRGSRALTLVAQRTGALPNTVLLTAWCALLAHRAGQSSCVLAVPTSNRFLPQLARSVNTVSQDALLCLDVGVPSFDALLSKAWGAALNAYRHSRFDALALWEMIGRVTFERGSHFARDVVFNDVSTLPASLTTTAAPPGAAAAELDLSWGPEQVLPTRVLVFVYQTDPQLHLGMWADPALFSRQEAEDLLTGLVRLLEAAGADDVPSTSLTEVSGIRPVERGPYWQQVDGCWTSPPAVAAVLRRVLGGLPVHVTTEGPATGGPSGTGLTAFIATGDRRLTPAGAHAALMEALPGQPGLLAPRWYVMVQEPPAQTRRSDAWFGQHILMEGTGRDRQM